MEVKKLFCLIVLLFVPFLSSCSTKEDFKEVHIELESNYNEFITQEEMVSKGHISIAEEFLTSNSIGYNNLNGSQTIYLFANTVNIYKNNQWWPIDNRIKNTTNAEYRNKEYIYSVNFSDIQSYFNKNFDSERGVIVKNDILEYELLSSSEDFLPALYQTETNFLDQKKQMIVYQNVSNGSNLRMYPSSLGVNCEISFSNNKMKTYMFLLKINNEKVFLRKEPGGYYVLLENKTNESGEIEENIIGVIQAPLLKEKSGTICYNNDLEITAKEKGVYEIRIFFDENRDLTDSLVYLTFEMRRDKQPDNALYSKRPILTNAYLKNYSVIGNNFDYGIGRLMIRFKIPEQFRINPDEIVKANFLIYSLTQNSDEFELETVLEDWCSITGNWSKGYKTGEQISRCSNCSELNFDITEEVKKWCGDNSGQIAHNGVLLKSTEEKEGVYNLILSNDNALYGNRTEIEIRK